MLRRIGGARGRRVKEVLTVREQAVAYNSEERRSKETRYSAVR